MLFDDNTQMEASLGKRFVNALVDGICIGIVNVAIGFTFGLILGITGNATLTDDAGINLFLQLLGLAMTFLFYVVFESAFQRTPGKLITGTKVVTSSGEKPSPKSIAIRTLCRFIPFEPLVGLFTSSFWHDTIPDVKVVDV